MKSILKLLAVGAALAGAANLSAQSCEEWSLLAPAALPIPALADWTTSAAGFNPEDGLTHILIVEPGEIAPNRWFTWNGAVLQERIAENGAMPFPGMHLGPSYSLCYDEANQRMLCLSGNVIYELVGDRWEVLPLIVPVQGARAVYDGLRGHVFISKGGVSYILNGQALTSVAPTITPPAREYGGLVYDPVREVVVLHGGRIGSTVLGDTWEWNGETWTLRTDILSPTPAFSFAMAWDPGRERIVRHGGRSTPGNPGGAIDETWIYPLGEPWALAPATGIGAKHRHTMAGHDDTGRLLIIGGGAEESGGDIWISGSPLLIAASSPDVTADAGDSATLWVHAIGTDLTYQWRFNSVPIPGATGPALVIENLEADDMGNYRCFVSTPCETNVTEPIEITVLPTSPAGDVDGDGDVDFADLNLLLSNYNTN